MAADGASLPRVNPWFAVDGAITIVAADDPVELALRRDRVAKRSRDEDLILREEADACGWSAAIPERSLALRRRRGSASPSSSSFGRATVVVAAEEPGCCREEASPDALGEGEEEELTWVDAGGEFFYLAVL